MTTLVKITITLALALLLSSCGFDINFGDFNSGEKGNGIVTTDTRPVNENFTAVTSSEGLEVYVTQADEFKIKVEADENIIDLIGTDIKNGNLKIYAIKNIGNATKKVFVSLPEISELKSSSGSHLKVESPITAGSLHIDASSGAILYAAITADQVTIDGSSGANMTLLGKAKSSTIAASSGANISAKDLVTQFCDAASSSGGNITIHVSESLTADASSGGNISYSGKAQVTSKKSVSGSVTFRD